MKSNKFTRAPLPFQGQKRFFISTIIKLMQDWQRQQIITPDTVFLDVFGGSGLIAHNLKQAFPCNEVIWNDFDDYQQRLDHYPQTRAIYEEIRPMLNSFDVLSGR